MKQNLLATFAVLAAASMPVFGETPEIIIRQVPVGELKAPAFRAPETVTTVGFNYCGYPHTAKPYEAGTILSGAMYLPSEILKLYDGAKITSISIFTGADQGADPIVNSIREGDVWITEDLDAEPLVKAHGSLSDDIMAYHPISLNEPYILSADKPVYVGFTITSPGMSQGSLVWDMNIHDNDWGGWMKVNDGPWTNMSEANGFVLMKCTIEGENIPQNSASIYSSEVSAFSFPGGTVSDDILILNEGARAINEIELSIKAGDEEVGRGTYPLDEDITFNNLIRIIVETRCNTVGANIPLRVEVTGVNGQPNENENRSITDHFLCLPRDGGFKRRVVMEQGTAQPIGGSLVGIVTDRAMTAKYGDCDQYIPIMVHMYDDMDAPAYEPLFTSRLCSTIPSVIPCRLVDYRNTPAELESVEDVFLTAGIIPAFAELDSRAYFTDENCEEIVLTTDMKFIDNAEGDWGLSFVTRENNVGPFAQVNPYSGKEEMGGFENEPDPVTMLFDHVARDIDTFYGIPESVPTSVNKDQVYTYTRQMPFTREQIENTDIVVMLINRLNGMIENATVLKGTAIATSSVESIGTISASVIGGKGSIAINGDYERASVFSVSGAVAADLHGETEVTLPAGVYIVVVDGKATKTIVK